MFPSDAPSGRFVEIHNKVKSVILKDHFNIISINGVDGLTGSRGGILHSFESELWNLGGKARVTENFNDADIIIMNISGENFKGLKEFLEKRGFRGVLCFWLHDNHVAHEANYQSVLEGDLFFSSHYGHEHEDYLLNHHSISAPILPACYRNVPLETVKNVMQKYRDFPRISKVVAPYFLYDFSPRTKYLENIVRNSPETVCFYTASADRLPEYYEKISETEKAIRWFSFKSSIVVPLNMDLSIRLFDGLIWGHSVIVPAPLPAFDHVIAPEIAERLGIVRYSMTEGVAPINEAAKRAISIFDQHGVEGVMDRHNFVVSNHLYTHRIRALLNFLVDFSCGNTVNTFVKTQTGWGMRARRADQGPLL